MMSCKAYYVDGKYYDMNFSNKINIVCGKSGVGKSFLVYLIGVINSGENIIKMESNVNVKSLSWTSYLSELRYITNSLVFIDSDVKWLTSEEFGCIATHDSNQYVIMYEGSILKIKDSLLNYYEFVTEGNRTYAKPIIRKENKYV